MRPWKAVSKLGGPENEAANSEGHNDRQPVTSTDDKEDRISEPHPSTMSIITKMLALSMSVLESRELVEYMEVS